MAEGEVKRKIEYSQSLVPNSTPLWLTRCPLCGSLVGDMEVHTEWHFPTPEESR